jgi:hypothetical protein
MKKPGPAATYTPNGIEPTISVFARWKTVHAFKRAVTAIDTYTHTHTHTHLIFSV